MDSGRDRMIHTSANKISLYQIMTNDILIFFVAIAYISLTVFPLKIPDICIGQKEITVLDGSYI